MFGESIFKRFYEVLSLIRWRELRKFAGNYLRPSGGTISSWQRKNAARNSDNHLQTRQ